MKTEYRYLNGGTGCIKYFYTGRYHIILVTYVVNLITMLYSQNSETYQSITLL